MKAGELSEMNAYLNATSAAWLSADGFGKKCAFSDVSAVEAQDVVTLDSRELSCSVWSRGYSCSK